MVPCVKSALIVLQFHTVVLHEPGTSKAISLSWYNTQIKTWSFPYSPGYQSKTPDISVRRSRWLVWVAGRSPVQYGKVHVLNFLSYTYHKFNR